METQTTAAISKLVALPVTGRRDVKWSRHWSNRMRLSQKKNCEGCRAASFIRGEKSGCELGFNNHGPYIKPLGIHRMVPQEPCYKPRNYSKLLEAIKLVREQV